MALAPCRECKKEVSTTAKTCPSCGVAHPANATLAAADAMQSCGCLLTVLITLPILFFLFLLF
jgi:hypothetical protein